MNIHTNNQPLLPYMPLAQNGVEILPCMPFTQNWVEISASAVEHNAKQFQQWLGPKTLIAGVIKSNAYGHGMIEIAMLYEQCKYIAALCVINLSEAVYVRQAGIKKTMLVIGYLDIDYQAIVDHDIEVTVYDLTIAKTLNEVGKQHHKKIIVHIKFDSGMSRLGVTSSELNDFIEQLKALTWIHIKGIFSHLAQSYNATRTFQQEAIFLQALPKDYVTHLSNSHGVFTTQKHSFARVGIGLYGYLQRQTPEMQAKLKPVLSLKTKILQIKSVKAGALIGYDATFQAVTDMIIAIIAIGYSEGLDARLSNCGSVIINAHLAPILGRVCMNLTIVDITNIPGCTTGQIVTILGKEGDISISAYDWSVVTQASVYNHLTKLSANLPRIITL